MMNVLNMVSANEHRMLTVPVRGATIGEQKRAIREYASTKGLAVVSWGRNPRTGHVEALAQRAAVAA